MIYKNLTTEEFIKRAKKIHGDKYIYTNVKYENHLTKVEVTCPEHGNFILRAQAHTGGQGCPKCSLQKITKWTKELDSLLIKNYPKMSYFDLAVFLKMSVTSIRRRTKFLGIFQKTFPNVNKLVPNKFWGIVVRSAKDRDIPFKIKPEDIENLYINQNKKCKLTGWEIYLGKEKSREITASVDRIDSDGDYTLDNIQIIHKDINKLKMDFPEDYLFRMVKSVYRNCKEKFQKYELIWEDDIFNDTQYPVRKEIF